MLSTLPNFHPSLPPPAPNQTSPPFLISTTILTNRGSRWNAGSVEVLSLCCSVDINLLDFVFDSCVGKCMGGEGKGGGERAVVVRIQIRCRSSRFPPSFLTPKNTNPPTHQHNPYNPPLIKPSKTLDLPFFHSGRNSHIQFHPPILSALKVHSLERFLPP